MLVGQTWHSSDDFDSRGIYWKRLAQRILPHLMDWTGWSRSLTQHFILNRAWRKLGCCVCVWGWRDAGVCWRIILLVCSYGCEHKICSACRKRLAGLCDDGTIKVSTVDIPARANRLSAATHHWEPSQSIRAYINWESLGKASPNA